MRLFGCFDSIGENQARTVIATDEIESLGVYAAGAPGTRPSGAKVFRISRQRIGMIGVHVIEYVVFGSDQRCAGANVKEKLLRGKIGSSGKTAIQVDVLNDHSPK